MPTGKRLRRIYANEFDYFVEQDCSAKQLVVVLCVREEERLSREANQVAELVNESLRNDASTNATMQSSQALYKQTDYAMAKFEMSESRFLQNRYNIHTVPIFLFFMGGKLVNASKLGGKAHRVRPTTKNAFLSAKMDRPPRTLLVEPVFKHQITTEKMLKQELFQWDLCLNSSDALNRVKVARESLHSAGGGSAGEDYSLIMLGDELSEADATAIRRCLQFKDNRGGSRNKSLVICGMTTSSHLRKRSVKPPINGGLCTDAKVALPSHLAEMCDVAVCKPIKANTLHNLAGFWADKEKESAKGPAASAGEPAG